MQEMMYKAARVISEPLLRHEKSTRRDPIAWQSAAQSCFQHQLRAHWGVGEIEVTDSAYTTLPPCRFTIGMRDQRGLTGDSEA